MYGGNFYNSFFYNWGFWGSGMRRKANAELLDQPPTLYYIMRSITDHMKTYDEMVNIKALCAEAREKIFYKNYPLSDKIDRATFETEILENFIDRTIAFDTVAVFQIKLINRLNAIMPKYNLMFDLLAKDMNIFTDTENKGREMTVDNAGEWQTDSVGTTDTREDTENNARKDYTEHTDTTDTQEKQGSFTEGKAGGESGSGEKEVITNDINRKKYSDTPQNRLSEVDDGTYLSEYTRTDDDKTENTQYSDTKEYAEDREGGNTETIESTGEKDTQGAETNKTTGAKVGNTDTSGTDSNTHSDNTETIERIETKTTKDLFLKLKQFEEYAHIKDMIYSDLECLFLQVL